MIFLFVFLFAAALIILYQLARADADFTLTMKRHAKCEEIEDRVVWITGASRGIGEVLAKRFARLGARLIISSRNEAELERVKKELVGRYAPHDVKVLPLDLSSGDSLQAAVEKAVSFFPDVGVDYMVHNAACERTKTSAVDVPMEHLKDTFEVNVVGTISLTQFLLPSMLKRGRGHFVLMSSAAGKIPSPGQAVYSASKHALNGYFHTIRSEFLHKGINVTVVCPGPIETSNASGINGAKRSPSETRVSAERCAELTIIAASHGLKEAWISYQPVLAVMYLLQYIPVVGYWLMDKIGGKRVEAAVNNGNIYSWNLIFGREKEA